METSQKFHKQLERIVCAAERRTRGILQPELGADKDWDAIQKTISEAFAAVLKTDYPTEAMTECRDLACQIAVSRLFGTPAWEHVRPRLLKVFSNHRGAIFEIKTLLDDLRQSELPS